MSKIYHQSQGEEEEEESSSSSYVSSSIIITEHFSSATSPDQPTSPPATTCSQTKKICFQKAARRVENSSLRYFQNLSAISYDSFYVI
jgi:hypothetical protein